MLTAEGERCTRGVTPPPAKPASTTATRRAASRVAGRASRLSQTFDFRMVERRRFRFTGGALRRPCRHGHRHLPSPPRRARRTTASWLMSAGACCSARSACSSRKPARRRSRRCGSAAPSGCSRALAWARRAPARQLPCAAACCAAALAAGAGGVQLGQFFAAIGWTSIAINRGRARTADLGDADRRVVVARAHLAAPTLAVPVALLGGLALASGLLDERPGAIGKTTCSARRCAGGLAHLRPRHAAGEGGAGRRRPMPSPAGNAASAPWRWHGGLAARLARARAGLGLADGPGRVAPASPTLMYAGMARLPTAHRGAAVRLPARRGDRRPGGLRPRALSALQWRACC